MTKASKLLLTLLFKENRERGLSPSESIRLARVGVDAYRSGLSPFDRFYEVAVLRYQESSVL